MPDRIYCYPNTNIMNRPLSIKQQDMINQVKATMAIENMPLSKQDASNLEKIAKGHLTADELNEQMKRKYTKIRREEQ